MPRNHLSLLRRFVADHGCALQVRAKYLVQNLQLAGLDAEDLVQETMKKADAALPKFSGTDEESVQAWLNRILENLAIDFIRRHYQKVNHDAPHGASLSQIPSSEKSPSSVARQREMHELLRAAIAVMPSPYQEVVVLRYVEGLDHQQIAHRLNRSVDAVKQQWIRGLRWLQKQECLNEL